MRRTKNSNGKAKFLSIRKNKTQKTDHSCLFVTATCSSTHFRLFK
jgi:hypothetical protein